MNPLTYAAEKQGASENAVSPQPTIAEVKQAWIEEATRVGLIEGTTDILGLQRLKKVLGATYASLVPGSDTGELRTQGLTTIRAHKAA